MDHHTDDDGITAWALRGIPEVTPGADLAELIAEALEAAAASRPGTTEPGGRRSGAARPPAAQPRAALADGDILVITSKVLSKAEGRIIRAEDREKAISDETVRVVATRSRPDGKGLTRIVENRLGIVGAAAGVDASNTGEGTVLLLPEDPDASAERLRAALLRRFGVAVGVIVSDTLGRAWRLGQTDLAIGAAGVRVVHDHRGGTDSHGRPLEATQIAVADELAATGDLVKGKAAGRPVAIIRGAGHLVERESTTTPGARCLVRSGGEDMFRLGTDEALAEGYRRARDELGSEP